jgi:molybdopterin molybdotransferase
MLGAVGPRGQLILGLPGNPMSTLVTLRRWGSVGLRKLAGFALLDPPPPVVELQAPDAARLNLWWHRPVRLAAPGKVELARSMGSGDVVAMAISDGFIELPPNAGGAGPWPFYPWSL